LLKALQTSEAAYGCAVVMEVATGEIKAMVNLSRTERGQYQERYNYALGSQGTTEPGSTFKLVSMLALLEETSLALTDTVDTGDGSFLFYDRTMKDVKVGGHGEITIQEVFEKSSNVGMARLINETFGKNPQKFINYVRKLNFTQPIGLQVAGAGVPLIQTPTSPGWSGVTLPWMSIGYALKITPLHTLTLYNAVANGGKMVQPIIIKRIKHAHEPVRNFEAVVLNKHICSKPTLEKLKTMLEGVVERGKARRFSHGFYKIAGKSGTANKVEEGRYTNDTYISFVGYFPAELPRYSCIVVMDSPKGYAWHFGASMAAVIKDIADKIAAKDLAARGAIAEENEILPPGIFPLIRAGYAKELQQLCHILDIPQHKQVVEATWVRSATEGNHVTWKDNGVHTQGVVPNTIGMTLKNALFLLENCGLRVTIEGRKSDRVKAQSLPPGSNHQNGQNILLQMD
jgi:cell division protein FtsI (penicillin-binding protein 3)